MNIQSTQIKPAHVGSISHGTLRTEDLLSAFADELESQILVNGGYFSLPENFNERDKLNTLHGEAMDAVNAHSDDESEEDDSLNDQDDDERNSGIVNDLQDALNQFAPPYCYFGNTEGDGSDFGYWPSRDEIEELPTVEDRDEAKELGEDCKSVNDHGNVTVYGGDGSVLLELV